MSEIKVRNQEDNTFKKIMIGAYYRAHRNWKVGLFYSRESGLLHDDDWEKAQENGSTYWGWKHTDERIEQIYITDITYRNHVDTNLVFEVKNRINYNSFNHHQFLRFRPGLTYFIKNDLIPFINVFLQYETYHPLSGYSEKSIYEKWIYFGGLYHLNKILKLGAFAAKKEINWESGAVKSDVLGLNLILNY